MNAPGGDPGFQSSSQALDVLMRILRGAVAAKASDLHLRVGIAPRVRIQGQLLPLEHPPLAEGTIESALTSLASVARIDTSRLQRKQTDFSCEVPEAGRFRVHTYRQAGTLAAALRFIASPIPDLASLRLPPVVKRIAQLERGIIVVSGATGNGKSTTIASLLEHMNQKLPRHIVTLEEPIEYIFQDKVASFSQREIGRDVESMQQGLEGVLREDPDVLFVGECRSLAEFDVVLNAAESGRVVVTTFHSADAERAIARMIGMYPTENQEQARNRLADALGAIICQKLITPRKGNLMLVTEVMTRAPTVIECIRDATRLRGLTAAIEKSSHEHGCHSFDQVLLGLVREGIVSVDTAKAHVHSANDFVRALNLTR